MIGIADGTGFWGGWTLATVANLSAVVVAVAFAARAWLAGIVLRWIGDKNQTWPIAADVLTYNATTRHSTGPFGTVEIRAEILIRPRWGTWTKRHHPKIESAVLTAFVSGKAHKREFKLTDTPDVDHVPINVDQPREVILLHLEKDILATRLPQGGHARSEFTVVYPPHRRRRCVTEDLEIPELHERATEALIGGDRGWKIKKWGLRGLKSKQFTAKC